MLATEEQLRIPEMLLCMINILCQVMPPAFLILVIIKYLRVVVYFGQLRKDSVISPINKELRLRVFHPDTGPHVTYLSSPNAQPHPSSCAQRAHALCGGFRR